MPIVLVDDEELEISTEVRLFLRRLSRAGYVWKTEPHSHMILTYSIKPDYGCCPIVALAHKRTGLPVYTPASGDYKSPHWQEFLYNGGAACGYYDGLVDIATHDRRTIIRAADFHFDYNTRLLRKYMLQVLHVNKEAIV